MLTELRVENLLLIERAELRLAPGLNVLTGETGAGKTVLAHALDLLLGGRARAGIVAPGAAEAWVEGAFELTPRLAERLAERLPADADEVVLARRVSAEGRTRAYLNGRAASAADLREVGGELIAFYGQHEHRRLMLASAQLEILDRYCGAEHVERRGAHAAVHARVRAAEAELEQLRERAGGRERELDLLEFELREIEDADPRAGEQEELTAERDRLRHLEGLRAAALAGAEALAPDSGATGATALMAAAERELDALAGVDARLDGLAERHRALRLEADDVAADLRRYEQDVEAAPGRLEQVEERLALLARLARKHGGSVEAVLEHAQRCRERRGELAGAEESLEAVSAQLEELRSRRGELDGELTAVRTRAAPRLAAAVRERLGELAMEGARFEVALAPREAPGPAGGRSVEMLIAPNPGVPAAALRETASGGELSRIMLALLSVAAEGDASGSDGGASAPDASDPDAPMLVFDEVDAGIGGHTARAVGERLRRLGEGRQLLCITHLPQVASVAERHFRIVKDVDAATARASVAQLASGEVVSELVRMLGADAGDRGARRHAQELLRAA